MHFSHSSANGVQILGLIGRLDANSSPDAETQLSRLIDRGETRVLINLEQLDYLSSAGLRVLLVAAKRLNSIDGELRICGTNDLVKEIFQISGFDNILNVHDTQTDALEGFL